MLIPLKTVVPRKGILSKPVFIPKLISNPLASSFLVKFKFLLLHTTQFDETNIRPFSFLTTLAFYFMYLFYTSSKQ